MAKLLWSITIAIGDLGGIMRSWRSEPYLWVHLAGIAAVPICLEICLLGLAASESHLPPLLVMSLVAVVGIAPIVWMQWQRPFYIFSLLPLVLKPAQLTENQRRLLRRFKAPLGRVLTVAMVIVSIVLLWQLQQWVPSTMPMAQIVPWGSIGGLLLAIGAFLMSNLFLQVPASVLAVLVTPEALLRKAEPYPVTSISSDFSLLGIPVKQILPPITESPAAMPSPTTSPAASSSSGSAVADRATQEASEPEAVEPEPVSESVESPVASNAPETTVDLETETAPMPEISAEPEVAANLDPETEPDAELSEETETASETPFETEADVVPEPKLSLETEPSLEPEIPSEPETHSEAEPSLEPETRSEPEAEPEAEPEFTSAPEETNWGDEETNWDEPETEPARSEEPIVSASGIIEAEMVETPIEAETVRGAETENTETPIEILATLERPIAISARLEDPEDPIEPTSLENPFEEAAAELPQIGEIGLPTVQDTVVTIIPANHLPSLDLEADLPTDRLPEPEQNHTVESTIVTIIPNTNPNTNSSAELPPGENG